MKLINIIIMINNINITGCHLISFLNIFLEFVYDFMDLIEGRSELHSLCPL